MASEHFRAQIIGAGRSVVASAAYRHRAPMLDMLLGKSFDYSAKQDLVHEEISIPENAPQWVRELVQGSVAEGSERLWNEVVVQERQINGQHSREIVIGLPIELSKEQNIALMREFIAEQIAPKNLIADWVYHDAPGNPHVHLMHTLRPVAERGFGPKGTPVLGKDGEPIRIGERKRLIYQSVIGGRDGLKDWRNAWGEVANRHLALAGYEARVDMRSYRERGIDLEPTTHLGPGGTAVQRKMGESQAWTAREAARFETADKIMEKPGELLKLVSGERSTFNERDLAKTLHRFIDDPETFANVRAKVMASEELVEVRGRIVDPETNVVLTQPVYSTREMVRVEHDMALAADRLAARGRFGVKAKTVAASIRTVETKDPLRPFKFDPEQVAAVEHVTGKSGVAAVVGYAGAGKSTLLEAANHAWVADGRRVFGAALAGKAAEGLEESAGIQSRTLASWELSWKNGRDLLERGDVFVIDEAGMVSSKQLSRFITAIEAAGAKAVLVGDAMQLQPIEAGAAFRAITERIGYVELVGIRRQKEEWAQEASRQFARGEVRDVLEAYRERGHVVEISDKVAATARIVADWSAARTEASAKATAEGRALKGDELLVLAHTNADVLALNAGIRDVMKRAGALADERAFVTERGTRQFAVGDRTIFLKNERFEEKLAPELGRQQVKNGMLGTVVATVGENGEDLLRVRLDNGREVAFSENTYRNVDHGYAATIHKSQGATVDRVFVMASKSMDQHLSYVAMSRHRHQVTLYAPQSEFKSFDRLAETLGRSGAKSTTLDFANEAGYREAVDAFATRRGIETLTSIAPNFAAFVERQTAWVEAKRAELSALWSRAGEALGVARDRAEQQDVAVQTVEPAIVQPAPPVVPVTREGIGFAAVTSFQRGVEADAHQALVQSPDWQHRLAQMQPLIERIYRNPAEASAALGAVAVDMNTDPRGLDKTIADTPQSFGAVRGGDSLVAGQAGRGERADAIAAATDLAVHGRSLAQSFRRDQGAAIAAETGRRAAMQTVVPDLSETARARLQELEAVRAAAGVDAWRDATRMIMKDKAVAQELGGVATAIADRFGRQAFTERAGEREQRQAFERVSPDERAHLTKVSDDLAAIRRFGGELAFVERMAAARAEAKAPEATAKQNIAAPEAAAPVPAAAAPPEAAPVAKPQAEAAAPEQAAVTQGAAAPLFAAVTRFADSVEAAARVAVKSSPAYREQINTLSVSAAKIWQDAAAAVEKIEHSIATGTDITKLEAALKDEPSRAGPLRGSDKLLDRFSAAGAERKAALQELPAALAAIRKSGRAYDIGLTAAVSAERAIRERMGIEIPALSKPGQEALDRLDQLRQTDPAGLSRAVLALPRETKDEFATLKDSLDRRFGRNAFETNVKDLDRHVGAGRRAELALIQQKLKTLNYAVKDDIGHKRDSEIRQKNISQGTRLTR